MHGHAAYIIEVPPRWNGDLVMWAHGYRGQGTVLTVDPPAFGLRQRLLDQGYAWAASSYYANGFDIRAGVLSDQGPRRRFRRGRSHRPHRTYIAGVSMGGHVIGRSLEQYPGFYDGALPMCGVLGDQTLFDFFLDYNLVAQALAGVSAYPIPADYLTNRGARDPGGARPRRADPPAPDTTNDLGKQLRDITINLSGGPRPGADARVRGLEGLPLLARACPTRPATPRRRTRARSRPTCSPATRRTPRSTSTATVQRVAPETVRQRLSGADPGPADRRPPRAPVLSPARPRRHVRAVLDGAGLRADVARHGRGRLLVQRAIRATQHCEFTPAEAGAAWDDLVRWVDAAASGRPATTWTDRTVVARPTTAAGSPTVRRT